MYACFSYSFIRTTIKFAIASEHHLSTSVNIILLSKRSCLLYTNIDQTLGNSLNGLLNFEIGGLDWCVIIAEYRTRVHCLRMYHLFCNARVHVNYSGVSGQCSHTIA